MRREGSGTARSHPAKPPGAGLQLCNKVHGNFELLASALCERGYEVACQNVRLQSGTAAACYAAGERRRPPKPGAATCRLHLLVVTRAFTL